MMALVVEFFTTICETVATIALKKQSAGIRVVHALNASVACFVGKTKLWDRFQLFNPCDSSRSQSLRILIGVHHFRVLQSIGLNLLNRSVAIQNNRNFTPRLNAIPFQSLDKGHLSRVFTRHDFWSSKRQTRIEPQYST